MSNRFALDEFRCLTLSGPDALAFAQAQFTVDIGELSDTRWQPLAWCDPKGRVLAFMMARSSEGHVELILPACQVDAIRQGLTMFTIGRDVRLSEARTVAASFEADPCLVEYDREPSRFLACGNDACDDPDAAARWRRHDLCRGLPWLDAASSGQHLPQWLGLEALGALSYRKGCFPGQEVIARLHYRGSVKYGVYGLKFVQAEEVASNAEIRDDSGERIGRWLRGPGDGASDAGLAVLRAGLDSGHRVLVGESGAVAQVTMPKALC